PTNVAGAETTEMFDLDSGLDLLVRQEPPNDGTLRTVGPLGVHVPPEAGFEIVTDGEGKNRGLAAFASTLYDVDLATGTATSLGAIGAPAGAIVGLSTIAEQPCAASARSVPSFNASRRRTPLRTPIS